jgi:DinB family protein
MNAEIESDSDQLLSIRQDALGLMSGLSDVQFNWQPGPGRWSMAGCFDHLNKSAAQLFIPNIDTAIAAATTQGLKSDGPFAYSALERWAVHTSDAPARMRFKAPKNVRPAASLRLEEVRTAFIRWQDEIAARLRQADGLDLRRAKYTWPFWPLKWSLGASFQLMLAHERRHVWQARQVRQSPGFPS